MIKITPTLEQARELLNPPHDYTLLPVCAEMYSDMCTPMEVMRILKGYSKHCFILESVTGVTDSGIKERGRYTFLGFEPKMKITCQEGVVTLTDNEGNQSSQIEDPPARIRHILDANKAPKIEGLPPFCGGLVGYFAYDYAKYSEPNISLKSKDRCFFRDVDLMMFDKVIAFDRLTRKLILVVNIRADKPDNLEAEYERGKVELQYLMKIIQNGTRKEYAATCLKSDFKALFNGEQFCRMVKTAGDCIQSGEIERVVLSNRYEADFEGSLFDAYRVLRGISPLPYMFYFSGTDFEIIGCSPETLVKLKDGEISTGSGESYIKNISEDKSAPLDIIAAVLPASTLSGTPKLRAIEIIDSLEQSKRGIYGGAVGYLDFTGNMDTCIALRVAYKKDGKVYVRSGAEITNDTTSPELKYKECENNSADVIKALKQANGGLEE